MQLSKNKKGTPYPFWIIIDPAQNFKVDSEGIYNIARMITGVWFSRKKAEEFLKRTRYNFSEHAKVFCASGTYSEDWVEFCKTNRYFDIPDNTAATVIAIYEFMNKGGICSYKKDDDYYCSESFLIKDAQEALLRLKEGRHIKFSLDEDLYRIVFYRTGKVKIEKL